MTERPNSPHNYMVRALEPYVPRLVRERLARDSCLLTDPLVENFSAAVLFADIFGFTSLAEELARSGAGGTERLKQLLDLCFGGLVESVTRHGGDVVNFPGDGAIALWRTGKREEMQEAVYAAGHCALDIQQKMERLETVEGRQLRLRVAIAAGPVYAASVGGIEGRWALAVGGEAVAQLASVAKRAEPGEVVLSREAAALIEASDATAVSSDCRLLRQIHRPAVHLPAPTIELADAAEPALRQYVSRIVQTRLDAGQAEWLTEYRYVTVMFVNVASSDFQIAVSGERLHRIARRVQQAVYRYGGSMNDVSVDEKGLTIVSAWGQSLSTHDDDAVRACRAALLVHRELEEVDVRNGIGVTTGAAFVGARGSSVRAEYAVIGDVVNVAARLMIAARRGILCDGATRLRSRRHILFEKLPPIAVKGKETPIAVVRPVGEKEQTTLESPPIFGRKQERLLLAWRLDTLAQEGRGGVTVMFGEAGIGKSRIIADLLARTQGLNVRSVVGAGEDLERSSPYFAWRGILRALLRLDMLDREQRRESLVQSLGEERDLAPLLNVVLGLSEPENASTLALTTEARAERTRELLIGLIRRSIANRPTMIVLEDGHWLDSASWALAEALHRAMPEVLLVISSRILSSDETPAELRRLIEISGGVCLLQALPAEDAIALLCHRLDVDSVPEELARGLMERTEGHPFFLEQLASALRDQGIIRVADGECELGSDTAQLKWALMPETVQAVIRARIDRVTPQQQLTLKIAAVRGREFAVDELQHIYPIPTSEAELEQQLLELTQLMLLEATGDGSYTFTHAITQEVAYGLMAPSQRSQLHRLVAEDLESRITGGAVINHALLAHHWTQAEQIPKALDHLEKAGELALASFANREAVNLFDRAIKLTNAESETASSDLTLRCAYWRQQVGEALWLLGETQGALEQLTSGLAILGFRVPDSRMIRVAHVVVQTFRQFMHLCLPGRFREKDPEHRRRLARAAEVAGRLAWIHMLRRDGLGVVLASLVSANLAERAQTQHGFILGVLGYTVGTMKMERLARRYFSLARAGAAGLKELKQLLWVSVLEVEHLIGIGRLARAAGIARETVEVARRTGDRQNLAHAEALLGIACLYLGRFADYRDHTQRGLEALRDDPSLFRPFCLLDLAHAQSCLLKPSEALASVDKYRPMFESATPADNELAWSNWYRVEAQVLARNKQWERASKAADLALSSLTKVDIVATVKAFDLLEVYGALWENSLVQHSPEAKLFAAKAWYCFRKLRMFVWLYPVHWPAALLYRGQMQWLSGRGKRARKSWTKGQQLAKTMAMPFDEALLLYELGRTHPGGPESGKPLLQRSRDLFLQCGASSFCDKVDDVLNR